MVKLKKLIIFIALFLISLVILPLGGLRASAQETKGLDVGGETTVSEGVYTVKNGYVKSRDQYNGYILTLKLKASEDASFRFEFGEYSLSFSADGTVADGFTLVENTLSYSELNEDCILRIEAFGTEFSMGVYSGGALEGIYDNVLEGTLPKTLQQCQVAFSATQGEVYIRDFNGYTLNSTVEIETENYDKEKEEAYNQLIVKPEKDEATANGSSEQSGCGGCVGSASGAVMGVILATVSAVGLRYYNRKKK